MIADVAWTRIRFEDVPLAEAAPAHVINVLAAVLACGFWHMRDGQPWINDLMLGPKHVQDFKHSPRSALRREVIARFEAVTIKVEGQLMTAPDVAALYSTDAAFRRRCEALPKFEGLRRRLTKDLSKQGYALCAQQHERQIILPVHGNLEMKTLLADDYEG